MKAFRWLFSHFAAGFLLVLVVQVAVVGFGVRIALSAYAEYQQDEFETIARSILSSPSPELQQTLSYANPFFVLSTDGELVFSNRGRGRAMPEEDLEPVRQDGSTLGYFHAGGMKFMDNEANRIFLSTILLLAGASLVGSTTIGVILSLRASHRIAGAVSVIRTDIHKIESRKAVTARSFVISELTDISNSLSSLSVLLANEENYKRQWMQDIAHDLRTPVSGLKGQIEGMRDGVLEISTERLERNLTEIDRLEDLVRDISELYTIENTDSIDEESFPALPFIEEVVTPHELNEKGVSARISTETTSIQGDRKLLLRAVGNIVSNAFAYSDPGGTVEIAVRENRGSIQIEVADNGPGISPDQIEKIFHRFFRGEYARNAAGTGLGLNIAKAIVERHAGEITVKNRAPRGALFIISLPAERTPRS